LRCRRSYTLASLLIKTRLAADPDLSAVRLLEKIQTA
jgi:hypothetical protein